MIAERMEETNSTQYHHFCRKNVMNLFRKECLKIKNEFKSEKENTKLSSHVFSPTTTEETRKARPTGLQMGCDAFMLEPD